MSLRDQSVNLGPRRNTSANHGKRPGGSSNPSIGPFSPPLAVQSMLRTTTECGDIASLHRSLIHAPLPRVGLQPIRPRSGSYDSSFASALRHHQSPRTRLDREHAGLRQPIILPKLARHDTVYSNLSPYTHAPRRRNARNRWQVRALQGLDDPRFSTPVLHGHRSLMTLRNFEGGRSRHPDTPSTPSSRRGHQPFYLHPSHLWLDENRMSRPRPVFAESRNSTASSSISFRSQCGAVGYNLKLNASAPLLPRFPSPAISTAASHSEPPHTSRTRASKAVYERRGGQISDIRGSSDKELAAPISEHSIPRYYDYSESFTEEDCFSPDSRRSTPQVHSNIDDAVMQSYAVARIQEVQPSPKIRLGSMFLPAELPAQHIRQIRGKADTLGRHRIAELVADEAHVQDLVSPVELPARTSPNKERTDLLGPLLKSQDRSPKTLEAMTDFSKQPSDIIKLCSGSQHANVSQESDTAIIDGEKTQQTAATGRLRSPLVDEAIQKDAVNAQAEGDHELSGIPGMLAFESSKPGSATDRLGHLPSQPSENHRVSSGKLDGCRGHRHPVTFDVLSQENLPQFQPSRGELTMSDSAQQRLARSASGLSVLGVRNDQRTVKLAFNEDNVYSDRSTPYRPAHMSIVTSNGKSTIESLLDRHIESLGLMPEPESPCRPRDQLSSYCQDHESDRDDHVKKISHDFFWQNLNTQSWCFASGTRRMSSPDSRVHNYLKPPRLFAGINDERSARPVPAASALDLTQQPCQSGSRPSDGWVTLQSTSQGVSRCQLSKLSLTSGELADIDTNACSPTSWNLSQFSLPTTMEEVARSSERSVQSHAQLPGVPTQRQRYGSRRKVKIHVRQPIRRSKSDDFLHRMPTTPRSASHLLPAPLPPRLPLPPLPTLCPPSQSSCSELPQVSKTCENEELDDQGLPSPDWQAGQDHQFESASIVPSRWSGVIAAMPVPLLMHGSRTQGLTQKVSSRTRRSRPSLRSHPSMAEPLNSSHPRTQSPHLGGAMPRLAPPDLGPPLDTSTLNLSIPYAEVPSTIHPSPQEARSFFDDSPAHASQQGMLARFKLPCLFGTCRDARSSSSLARVDSYDQACRIRDMNSFRGTKTRTSLERPDLLDENASLGSCAYRTRTITQRMRSWWRPRCCWPKIVAPKRRRASYMKPGGLLV